MDAISIIMAVAGDLEFFKGKAIHIVDYLEADRLEFHYRIAVHQVIYGSYFPSVQYACDIVDTPS